jgi:non-specific serine/threonine protein kinase
VIFHCSDLPDTKLLRQPLGEKDSQLTTLSPAGGNDVEPASDGVVEMSWRLVVLDEAQAIKNHRAKQTRAAKTLKAEARIALTGTPLENHLGDLWSIFDFINPGLLGNAKEFGRYAKALTERPHNPYGPLRDLVRPYILRRMKTDKAVIADLPDKTEVRSFCPLKQQSST